MVKILNDPLVVQTDFGTVTLTHEDWSYADVSDAVPYVRSVRKLGVEKDGAFVEYGFLTEVVKIGGADYAALLAPNQNGKVANTYRTDDVQAMHHTIRARG